MAQKTNNRKMVIGAVLLFFCFVLLPSTTHAIDRPIELEIAIGPSTEVVGLVDYIVEVYQFIVGVIGIIAAVVLMYWGFRWITAAGNQTIIGSAKEGIVSALIGLVIALTSYSLLQFLNPAFVGLQSIDVPTAAVEETDQSIADSVVNAVNCDEVGTNFLQSLPANLKRHLNWSSGGSEPCLIGSSYTALVTALTELDDPESPYYGMKLDISSAFRSNEQQTHLYNCYRAARNGACNSYTDENGQSVSCSSCNEAAQPGRSRHQTGYALDVAWTTDSSITAPNTSYTTLVGKRNTSWHDSCAVGNNCAAGERESLLAFDAFMQGAGFERICIEWWHFETGESTGAWCGVGEYR